MALKLLLTFPISPHLSHVSQGTRSARPSSERNRPWGYVDNTMSVYDRPKIEEVFSVEKYLFLHALALAQETLHFDNPSDL